MTFEGFGKEADVTAGTIYALATPPGRSGVAVVRLSGAGAIAALKRLSGGRAGAPRVATLMTLTSPLDGSLLDRALTLVFPAPHSFTGEDVVELHVHGGIAVTAAVLEGLAQCDGLRPALAGEFTRRAFENGKLDLMEVEGLADLVEAQTRRQREQALRQMAGASGRRIGDWRKRLIRALAFIEAEIDFVDEGDVGDDLGPHVLPEIKAVREELESALDDGHRGEVMRQGVRIAIIGPPNVGKSSLLNWMAGREAAIVSPEAGTTRDLVEVWLDFEGIPVCLCDTAGMRAAASGVEAEGIRRARTQASEADIRLVMEACSCAPDQEEPLRFDMARSGDVRVANKADVPASIPECLPECPDAIIISLKTGYGLESLQSRLTEIVVDRFGKQEPPVVTRARHRHELEQCRAALKSACKGCDAGKDVELTGEELRRALRALGRISGGIDVEDILDVVFSDFCIGK